MLAAASAVVGWGAGIIFVGLAGISELLPNKYRCVTFFLAGRGLTGLNWGDTGLLAWD